MVLVGFLFANKLKNIRDMFAAGGRSPWWISGLSGFMTMFTANTFVVWGGIAYKHGFIAIAINLCYGISAILVGLFIAGRWQKMGLTTVAQFVEMRFGKTTVQLYTWIKGLLGIFLMGAGVYAFSRIFCAIIPMSGGHWLADPKTGNLSIDFVSIALSVIVVVYTMAGGLWAVLVTGVLQFVVLMVSVLLVLVLAFTRMGNIPEFVHEMPEGFWNLTAPDMEYTWFFLAMWVVIHIFVWGGEWQFAQRYICVPTVRDAKKTAYLIGGLYLVSPIIWMLPPLLYRGINPDAFHEEAYILMCREVLPVGMLGLMIAAMLSATSSSVASVLNVYAGAYTYDLYYAYVAPQASERHLLWAGRVITMILGLILISSCLIISRTDVTKFVIISSSLLYTPWLLPTLWGLFSRRIGQKDFWITVGVSMLIIAVFMICFNPTFGGVCRTIAALADNATFQDFISYIDSHPKTTSLYLGNIPPVLILIALQVLRRKTVNPGWERVQRRVEEYGSQTSLSAESLFPAKVITWSLGILGLAMIYVTAVADENQITLGLFTAGMILLSILLFFVVRRSERRLSVSEAETPRVAEPASRP
jgi:solute:Na+ symporter, SSS family